MPRLTGHGQPIGDAVDWSGAMPVAPVVLEGATVRLEPLGPAHARDLLDHLAGHPELWTYRGDEPPADLAEAERRVATSPAGVVSFAIVPRGADGMRGMVSLLRADEANGSIEVGSIAYAPSLQRTRAATEVQYLLARHVFDELGYRRYEWKCDSLNAPSRRAALRLGFVEEGTFRQAVVVKGRNRDTTWFSITDTEWPRVRAGLETWLDDRNHETGRDGSQIRSLTDCREGRPRG